MGDVIGCFFDVSDSHVTLPRTEKKNVKIGETWMSTGIGKGPVASANLMNAFPPCVVARSTVPCTIGMISVSDEHSVLPASPNSLQLGTFLEVPCG